MKMNGSVVPLGQHRPAVSPRLQCVQTPEEDALQQKLVHGWDCTVRSLQALDPFLGLKYLCSAVPLFCGSVQSPEAISGHSVAPTNIFCAEVCQ